MYSNIFPGIAHFKYWILVLNHIIWEKFISNTFKYACVSVNKRKYEIIYGYWFI